MTCDHLTIVHLSSLHFFDGSGKANKSTGVLKAPQALNWQALTGHLYFGEFLSFSAKSRGGFSQVCPKAIC